MNEKLQEILADAKAQHEAALAEYALATTEASQNYWQGFSIGCLRWIESITDAIDGK